MNVEEKLKNIMTNNDPILFLGAGFSYNSKKDFKPILIGDKLKENILSKFLYLIEESEEYKELVKDPLPEICDYAERKKSKESLQDHLSHHFSGIEPEKFHEYLFLYNWKKIYTTNIDDLVESITRKKNIKCKVQNSKRYINNKQQYIEYIKLHGCVHNPSEQIVFSADSYIDSMVTYQSDYRINSFLMDIQKNPFIFIGTEFHEWNLDYYLKLYENQGRKLLKEDLFFINPNPSIKLKMRLADLNATLIPWTTEKFLNFIKSEKIHKQNSNIFENKLRKKNFINKKMIISDLDEKSRYRSKLYLGFDPQWEDIFYEWDFFRDITKSIINKVIETKKNHGIMTVSNYYSGKSTLARRIFAELSNINNQCVLFFTGNQFTFENIDFLMKNITENKVVLIVDDSTDYYFSFKQVLETAFKDKIIIILGFSRAKSHIKRRYALNVDLIDEVYVDKKISEKEAICLQKKIEDKNVHGKLMTIKGEANQLREIRKHPDIISFLHFLTESDKFLAKIGDEIDEVKHHDPDYFTILLTVSIFYLFDIPEFPSVLLSMISKIGKDSITKYDDLVQVLKNKNLKVRNYLIAKETLKKSSNSMRIDSIKTILKTIAPQISEYKSNSWKKIYQKILREKNLKGILNLKATMIRSLYEELQDLYKNSSFFYLQLGTLEQEELDFDIANTHFQAAKAINPNSYQIDHAIGRNYLRKANNSEIISRANVYFEKGEKILRYLIDSKEKKQGKAYSIHCLLFEKMSFFERFKVNPSDDELKELNDLIKQALNDDSNDFYIIKIIRRFTKYLEKIHKLHILSINILNLSRLENQLKQMGIDVYDYNDEEIIDY